MVRLEGALRSHAADGRGQPAAVAARRRRSTSRSADFRWPPSRGFTWLAAVSERDVDLECDSIVAIPPSSRGASRRSPPRRSTRLLQASGPHAQRLAFVEDRQGARAGGAVGPVGKRRFSRCEPVSQSRCNSRSLPRPSGCKFLMLQHHHLGRRGLPRRSSPHLSRCRRRDHQRPRSSTMPRDRGLSDAGADPHRLNPNPTPSVWSASIAYALARPLEVYASDRGGSPAGPGFARGLAGSHSSSWVTLLCLRRRHPHARAAGAGAWRRDQGAGGPVDDRRDLCVDAVRHRQHRPSRRWTPIAWYPMGCSRCPNVPLLLFQAGCFGLGVHHAHPSENAPGSPRRRWRNTSGSSIRRATQSR